MLFTPPPRTTYALTFLLAVVLMFQSCEKETLAGTETTAVADDEAFTEIPQLENRPLSELHVSFINGVPAYENTQQFLLINRVVSHTPEAEYLAWAEREGLTSIYHDYLKLAERVEANPAIPSQEQITKAESRFIFHMEEGGVAINHHLVFPKLTDQKGRLYIGDNIHAFTPEEHILIDNGTPSQLKEALINPVSDIENGVFVEPNGEYDNPYVSSVADEKVQVESFPCPTIFVESTDNFLQGGNWWETHEGFQWGFERQDEQRVGCSKKRCRHGTWAFFMARHLLLTVDDDTYQAVTVMRYAFNNRRRNRFNWTRIFPIVEIEDNRTSTNSQMVVRVQTQAQLQNGTFVTRSNRTFNVNYPGILANGTGTAQEDITILDVAYSVNVPISDNGHIGQLSILDGSVSHRWRNIGNNTSNDPIYVEFRCE